MYKYNAKLIRVIDGSTLDANIDLGFGVFVKQRVRLFGVNCPDPKSKEDAIRAEGLTVKNRLIELIGSKFIIETILNKRGKSSRPARAEQPNSKVNELHEWFWSKTAIGMLITKLARQMNDDEDKETKSVSFGIAR